MARINTTSPPVGHPKRRSFTLTTAWATLIDVDDYQVSKATAGVVSTQIVPGVAELQTPLFLCNRTGTARWASVRITRADASTAVLVHQELIGAGDTLQVPVNGQFLLTGDVLEVQAQINTAIDATISWTQGEAEGDGS